MLGRRSQPLVLAFGITCYVAALVVSLPAVLDQLGWDADASSPMLLAETLARGGRSGEVLVGHMGYYLMIAFDIATYRLPLHRLLWTLFPIFLSMLGLGMLTWSALRVAGRWAAVATFAIGVAASPTVLVTLASQGYRAPTLFNTILLATLLVLLVQRRQSPLALAAAAAAVALVTGVDLASDAFLALWGVAPFLAGATAVAIARRDRFAVALLGQALLVMAAAAVVALTTATVARAAGFRLLSTQFHLASGPQARANLDLLYVDLQTLFSGPLGGPAWLGRFLGSAAGWLGIAGVGVLVAMAAREMAASRRGSDLRVAFLFFWATSAVSVSAAVVFTTFAVDSSSARYLVAITFAIAAAVPICASGVDWGRRLVSLVAAMMGIYMAGTLLTSVNGRSFQPAFTVQLPTVVHLLEGQGLKQGYATYWDANAITWQTGGRLTIYPVYEDDSGVHPFVSNVATSWYGGQRRTPTFLLVDPEGTFVTHPPGAATGRARKPIREERFSIFIYDHGAVIR
ncbi:MAG: hypothetical protein NVSMB17_01480 [Candidatus Dormibacteria bacterium]